MTETGELGSAYVVLACDGTVRVVPCADDFDVERELGLNLNSCIFFPDAFAAALDTLAIENGPQHAYGVENARTLANRSVWGLCGELHFGDAILLKKLREKDVWYPGLFRLQDAKETAAMFQGRLSTANVSIPEDLVAARTIETEHADFFARCEGTGLLDREVLILKFAHKEDLLKFRYASDFYRGVEGWTLLDVADDAIFVGLYCLPDVVLDGINTYRYCLDSDWMSRCVKEGRVQLFYGMRFADVGAFAKFRSAEAALEGKCWREAFRDERLDRTIETDAERMVNKIMGLPIRDSVWGGDFSGGKCDYRNQDFVLVETTLPVRWRDDESGETISLIGNFERG